MSKSILQPDEKVCFLTGTKSMLDKHHIYHGIGKRTLAEKYGCWVWLNHSVHMLLHDKEKQLDKYLQQVCQRKFEETHTREEFRAIFGKSYLLDDDVNDDDVSSILSNNYIY